MNGFLSFFRKRPTANLARERLQILLSHERASAGQEGLVNTLREEILAVIAKHIHVNRDQVQVKVERHGEASILEIDVTMPVHRMTLPT
ncbi:MAG: cell division topological specificity factor MinE [Acetobacteraceae bacterium]|nr:cell division topological specificity factor MinE [Acetobacteraceae bacterium]